LLTLDSNILVYAVDTRDAFKRETAMAIIAAAARVPSRLGLQVLGEFFVASTRKIRVPSKIAQDRIEYLLATFETFHQTPAAVVRAIAESIRGRFSYWDAVLLASAEEAGCTLMLSEDKADGCKLGNLVVRNPFGPGGLSDAAKAALALL
jgi:predicted nucleic acid-binding protein